MKYFIKDKGRIIFFTSGKSFHLYSLNALFKSTSRLTDKVLIHELKFQSIENRKETPEQGVE